MVLQGKSHPHEPAAIAQRWQDGFSLAEPRRAPDK